MTYRPTSHFWSHGLALVIILALLTPIASRGTLAQDDAKILRVHHGAYPDVIDPQQSSYVNELDVLGLIYEGLTRLDINQETVPGAAESWAYDDDAMGITFTLREGLTYSDGSPLTAERIRYAIERTCDPTVAGAYQAILFSVVGCAEFAALAMDDKGNAREFSDAEYEAARAALGVRAPDDLTLEVDFTQPTPFFHTIAYTWVLHPVKAEIVAADPATWWTKAEGHVGNGPFVVTGIDPDQRWSFAANERYWQGRPKLDGIEYVYIDDPAVALAEYRAGDLDILWVGGSLVDEVTADPELAAQLITSPVAGTITLDMSLTKEPFNDPKVREAFAYALDRETYCAEIMSGACVPALSWIPPGTPGHVETDAFAFDPEAANQALADSSYGGPEGLPEITFVYGSDNPTDRARVEWMAGQFRDILGVELALEPMEGVALQRMAQDPATYPQLSAFGGWYQDYPDPQNWLSVIWQCDSFDARMRGYCNEEFDRLVALGDTTVDPDARLGHYQEAERLLIADVPTVFLYHDVGKYLIQPNVTGIVPTASEAVWPGSFSSLMTMDKAD
jgi:oligopeptide transport system substrate-binding protein